MKNSSPGVFVTNNGKFALIFFYRTSITKAINDKLITKKWGRSLTSERIPKKSSGRT